MNIADVDALADPWLDWLPWVLGWSIGWALLARPRPLPIGTARSTQPTRPTRRDTVTVVVPARDEAHALPNLLRSIGGQLGAGDELIVVDDGSADDTTAVALAHGARVIVAEPPPDGWAGKSHACWTGASSAESDVIAFVDADVVTGPGLVDGLVHAVGADPSAVVSVQPWHTPQRPVEHLSLFGNLVALMGVGRFSIVGRRSARPVAFGAILAMPLDRYRSCGGHAAPAVRGAAIEDVALARLVGQTSLFTGRPHASFRMYPGGWPDLTAGWTRVLAAGIGAGPAWATFAAGLWLWAIAAAPWIGWWAYALAVVQVAGLSRIAGRFSPLAALAYPIPLVVFVGLAVRSLAVRVTGRRVRWKGRSVDIR